MEGLSARTHGNLNVLFRDASPPPAEVSGLSVSSVDVSDVGKDFEFGAVCLFT